jgi:hypothetical protein
VRAAGASSWRSPWGGCPAASLEVGVCW